MSVSEAGLTQKSGRQNGIKAGERQGGVGWPCKSIDIIDKAPSFVKQKTPGQGKKLPVAGKRPGEGDVYLYGQIPQNGR